MLRPANYRDWIWLSTGYATAYTPETSGREDPNPLFHNVFVNPAAYRAFSQTGKWPDKTTFVLELRASVEKGSINERGRFQGEVQALEVHVKDEHRFPNKWAFFGFQPHGVRGRCDPGDAELLCVPRTARRARYHVCPVLPHRSRGGKAEGNFTAGPLKAFVLLSGYAALCASADLPFPAVWWIVHRAVSGAGRC